MNEILLFINLIIIFSSVVLSYKLLGKSGIYAWTAIATILANIEVLMLVYAFGMEQTLGNILFASTFLATDILSETEGKKYANKACIIGIFASIVFIIISQSWFLYIPSSNDWAQPIIMQLFSNTPRIIFASLSVYAFVQIFDVWMYDKIWHLTEKIFKDKHKGLWIRNNGSTLISQLLNSLLFTFIAFGNLYSIDTLISIFISSYVIFIFTSLLDTPFVYMARYIKERRK